MRKYHILIAVLVILAIGVVLFLVFVKTTPKPTDQPTAAPQNQSRPGGPGGEAAPPAPPAPL